MQIAEMWLGSPPNQLFAHTNIGTLSAEGPRIVFLHGAQHDHSVWLPICERLAAQDVRFLALDLPGHGNSTAPLQTSVEAIANAVAASLREYIAAPVLLAGHSMGSLIALQLSTQLNNVAGIALLCAAAPMQVSDALLQSARNDAANALQMINRWSHSKATLDAASQAEHPDHARCTRVMQFNLDVMQQIEARNGASVLPTDFVACNAYQGALDAACALRCPALFLLADADRMTPPRAAQALIDAVSSPKQLVTLPNTGHAMMAESPDAVSAALLAFAQRCLTPAV